MRRPATGRRRPARHPRHTKQILVNTAAGFQPDAVASAW